MPTYEELDLTGINIDGYQWKASVLKANYGDGYGDKVLVGDSAGLWRWSLHSDCLPDDVAKAEINGLAWFDYYWDFFRRHTTGEGSTSEIFVISFRGKKYHASFSENYMSGEALTADLFNGDVEVQQRRVKGIAYNADGSIDETPPGAPVQADPVALSSTSIRYSWAAPADPDVTGYLVIIDGTTTIDVGNVLSYDLTGLTPSTSYSARIKAYDGAGNLSALSNMKIGTTDEPSVAADPFLDSLTMTTKYWYGFAKRRTAYSGPCVKVKNMTTNVLTDVGFDSDGRIDRTALTALFTGSQQLGIEKYYDQSGNGIDLSVGSDYDIIDLSGHRVGVVTATTASPSNGYTSTGTVTLNTPVFFSAVNFYNYGQSFLFDHGSGNWFSARVLGGAGLDVGKETYMTNGTAIQASEPLSYGAVSSDGIRILVHRFKSGNEEAWRDGVALTFSGTTDAGGTSRTGTVKFHDFAGGGGLGWTGQFFEFGCLDGTYSGTEKATIETAMRADFQDGPTTVWLGDSLAYGQSTPNVYTDGPAAKYKEVMPTGRDVVNRGYAGFTIPQIEAKVATHIVPIYRSTASRFIFVVDGGINDAVNDSATGATQQTRMTSLISTLKALGSNVEVYLRTNSHVTAWPGAISDINAGNALYKANWAAMGADGLIDITGDPHIGDTADTTNLTYYTGDEAHLTAAGYAIIAAAANAVIP